VSGGFEVGKLPPDTLARMLAGAPVDDPRIVLGPGVGLDCAVIDAGDRLLVYKSDPITFATDAIGYYLVQVNCNDIATTGATPRWLLLTLLLPEGRADQGLVDEISGQVYAACRYMGIAVIGGHTEVTAGLDRPIAVGALVGEVARDSLVTPRGARPGDRLLLSKGVPIEATAILARERPQVLRATLTEAELEAARGFLYEPGIGILGQARAATAVGGVTAMHDPTEGGLVTALWELARASGHALQLDPGAVPVPELSRRVCSAFGIDPLASIASGALILAASAEDAGAVVEAIRTSGVDCAVIGMVAEGAPEVRHLQTGELLPAPARDEIVRVLGG